MNDTTTVNRELLGAIFDFNGTLFRDSDKHEKAWKTISAELRGREFTDEELASVMHGRTNRSIFEYLLDRPVDTAELNVLTEEKENIYRRLCLDEIAELTLAPGASALLDDLKKRGVPIAIATASEINNVEFFISTFRLDRWFDLDHIVYDNGTFPGKPEPHIFRVAAGSLGLAPSQCVVFEDSASGLLSAHKAGIGRVVAVGRKARFAVVVYDGIGHQVFGAVNDFDGSFIG
jgi:HAD superfamily hydrolase (TIGR01509 family)